MPAWLAPKTRHLVSASSVIPAPVLTRSVTRVMRLGLGVRMLE